MTQRQKKRAVQSKAKRPSAPPRLVPEKVYIVLFTGPHSKGNWMLCTTITAARRERRHHGGGRIHLYLPTGEVT